MWRRPTTRSSSASTPCSPPKTLPTAPSSKPPSRPARASRRQRLGEVGEPLRIGDIADQLQMTPVAVARAVDRLVEREWAVRLASPRDRKAVFAAAMPQGERQQRIIVRTVALLARKHLWSRLDRRQRHALARTWRIVIADVQARKEAERKAALGLLQPID